MGHRHPNYLRCQCGILRPDTPAPKSKLFGLGAGLSLGRILVYPSVVPVPSSRWFGSATVGGHGFAHGVVLWWLGKEPFVDQSPPML